MRTLPLLVTALTLAAAGCGDRQNIAPPAFVGGSSETVDAHASDDEADAPTDDPLPQESPAESPEQASGVGEAVQTGPGQAFLRARLADLDSFKSDPAFHRFGFGRGGRFHFWLEQVDSKRDAGDFTLSERIAVGDLQLLGLEYMATRGRENDYTRYAREQIVQAISGGGS